MISLTGLEALVQVQKSGSFAAASEVLGLSPSAVSKSISRMEQNLGVKLLHRTTRRLSLTSDGERLLSSAERVMEELEQMESWLGQSRSRPSGTLRVSLPSGLGRNVMVDSMVDFGRCYPNVVLEASFEDRMVDLAGERVDVAVRTGDLDDRAQLIARLFFRYQTILCAAPSAVSRAPRSISDLEALPCLHFRNRSTGRLFPWRLQQGPEMLRLTFSGPLVFDDIHSLARATMAGAGIALLPTWVAADALRRGELIEFMPHTRAEPIPTWLTYLERRLVSPRVQAFVTFMAEAGPAIEARLRV